MGLGGQKSTCQQKYGSGPQGPLDFAGFGLPNASTVWAHRKKDWLSRHLLLLARRGNALEEFDFRWRTAQRSKKQTEARFFRNFSFCFFCVMFVRPCLFFQIHTLLIVVNFAGRKKIVFPSTHEKFQGLFLQPGLVRTSSWLRLWCLGVETFGVFGRFLLMSKPKKSEKATKMFGEHHEIWTMRSFVGWFFQDWLIHSGLGGFIFFLACLRKPGGVPIPVWRWGGNDSEQWWEVEVVPIYCAGRYYRGLWGRLLNMLNNELVWTNCILSITWYVVASDYLFFGLSKDSPWSEISTLNLKMKLSQLFPNYNSLSRMNS